uniref:Ependymin n=1 Tax=Pygocentrus nattereri TaxID=42514 RepID=A0AAR2J0N9_PYGNA
MTLLTGNSTTILRQRSSALWRMKATRTKPPTWMCSSTLRRYLYFMFNLIWSLITITCTGKSADLNKTQHSWKKFTNETDDFPNDNNTHSDDRSFPLSLPRPHTQGVLYEIDSKNESCKKQTLKYRRHPMELPSDAHYESEAYLGSPSKSEQGLRVRTWNGKLPDLHANYTMLTTSCGCLTVSYCYHSEKTDLYFSFMNVETEVDDAHVFAPPAYCDGVALEDTPDDHSFFDLFHD